MFCASRLLARKGKLVKAEANQRTSSLLWNKTITIHVDHNKQDERSPSFTHQPFNVMKPASDPHHAWNAPVATGPVYSGLVVPATPTHVHTVKPRHSWAWKLVSNFKPVTTNAYTCTQTLVPCQSRFTAKQYEANQGTTGMALPLLMKALWKGNLIHQQQLRLGATCHYQLFAPSLMFSSADSEPAWHTALSDKSTPSASQSLRALIMSVFRHTHTHTAQTHRQILCVLETRYCKVTGTINCNLKVGGSS